MAASAAEYKPNLVGGSSYIIPEALIGFRGGEASTGKRGWGPLVHEQKRE